MTPDQITSWVCANQDVVNWVLGILLLHFGSSVTSTILKWTGISTVDAGKWGTILINLIRTLAIDAHTTDRVVLKQAAVAAESRDMPVQAAVATAVANQPLPAPKG